MKSFDDFVLEALESLDKSGFNDEQLSIMLEDKNLLRYGGTAYYDNYCPQDLRITSKILLESFDNAVVTESDDPDYYAKLPRELVDFTRKSDGKIVDELDILTLFPEFKDHHLPKVYVQFFDFMNENEVHKIIKKFGDFDVDALNRLKFAFMKKFRESARGIHSYVKIKGIEFSFIFFNTRKYNERTIYHEWTHYFQRYVGEDFAKLMELHVRNSEVKEKKLQKFGLNIAAVENYFFSAKEYVTRLDNLLYMLHQVQKLPQYESLNEHELVDVFKDQVCRNELNSNISKDILAIDPDFKMDITFFIAAYICFKGKVFDKLVFDLANRL